MQLDLILKKPIITEKSMQAAKNGKFSFLVDNAANKNHITQAVETLFKVNVVSVSTSAINGKTKRFGKTRRPTKLSDFKKAIVELKKNQKIDLFDIKEK